MSRKRQMFDLVTQLHGLHAPTEWCAAMLGITPRRFRQIVVLLRLEPPQFKVLGEFATWLAREKPDLELGIRYFRNGNDEPPEVLKVA